MTSSIANEPRIKAPSDWKVRGGTTEADGAASITRVAVLAYLLLSLAYFVPAFFPDKQLAGTDYFAGGYFFLEFTARRFAAHAFPKWVPYVFGGVPMYANPGSTYYPLRLLFGALVSLDRVMAAIYVVQFAVAGIGMHLFLRALRVRPWFAFVGGVAFEFSGVAMSYLYAGQDGRIIGATLTPLVFFLVQRAVVTGQLRWFAGLGTALGMVLLSFQLQSAYYLMLAAGLWGVFLLVRARRGLGTTGIAVRAAFGAASIVLAFALAAVNILPFVGYIASSPRGAAAHRDYAFSTQFSMPPVETIGFAVPEQAGILGAYEGANPFKLHTEYVGAFTVLLLLLGAALCWRDPVWRFFGVLSLFMLTICYGGYTPIYALYYRLLPGTPKFRSPSIALFAVVFCFVVMACLGLDRLAAFAPDGDPSTKQRTNSGKRIRRPAALRAGVATVVIGIAGVLAAIVAVDSGGAADGWARFLAFGFAISLALYAWLNGRIALRTMAIALALVSVADLWLIDRKFFQLQPPVSTVFAPDDVARFLSSAPPGRVWVFPFPTGDPRAQSFNSGSIGTRSDYLMRFGIAQAGGEHGNQLQRWNELLGIDSTGAVDWHNFTEHPALLNALGVRYLVSRVEMQLYDVENHHGMAGLHEIMQAPAFVYRNDGALPRAALVPSVARVATGAAAMAAMKADDWDPRQVAILETASPVEARDHVAGAVEHSPGYARITSDDPDHIVVRAQGTAPSILVLNDNYADGWTARVDGRVVPILRVDYTLRGVSVAAGAHEVVFDFHPSEFYLGLWISAATAVVLVMAGVGLMMRNH